MSRMHNPAHPGEVLKDGWPEGVSRLEVVDLGPAGPPAASAAGRCGLLGDPLEDGRQRPALELHADRDGAGEAAAVGHPPDVPVAALEECGDLGHIDQAGGI